MGHNERGVKVMIKNLANLLSRSLSLKLVFIREIFH